MNMQHSGNRTCAILVAARPVILSAIPVAARPVILSATPVAARPVILSAIPVYRDVVEERGGMVMPPVFITRHNTITRETASPHIFRLHSTTLRCAQYDDGLVSPV